MQGPHWRIWIPLGAFFVAFAAFLVTLVKWSQERRDKLAERAERAAEKTGRETAEAELREITRRGRAPFLRVEEMLVFRSRAELVGTAQHAVHQRLRTSHAVEVWTETPIAIALLLTNDGEPVRNVRSDSPDGLRLEVHPAGLTVGAGCARLIYQFDKTLAAKPQRLTIFFETLDGLQLSQTYETNHNAVGLRRVDPA